MKELFAGVKMLALDWDGTMRNNIAHVYATVCSVFTHFECERPVFDDFIRHFAVPWMEFYRLRGIRAEEVEVVQVYRMYYDNLKDSYPHGYHDGVVDVIHRAGQLGIYRTIVSANLVHNVTPRLAADNLRHHFTRVVANAEDKVVALTKLAREADILPQQIVFIGDMISDMEHGRDAKVRTIGFAPSGMVARDALIRAGAMDCFKHFHEVLQVMG